MNDERCLQLLKAMRVREQRWLEEDPENKLRREQIEAFDHAILQTQRRTVLSIQVVAAADYDAAQARILDLESELRLASAARDYANDMLDKERARIRELEANSVAHAWRADAAEARIRELEARNADLERWHAGGRSNVEYTLAGVRICRGEHEKSESCEWVTYASQSDRGDEHG